MNKPTKVALILAGLIFTILCWPLALIAAAIFVISWTPGPTVVVVYRDSI